MIATNRDLATMQQLLDHEILRLHGLPSGMAKPAWINRRLASLCRQRIAICAARVNRRMEASKRVVEFSRWVNGDGALGATGSSIFETPRLDKAKDAVSVNLGG